MSAFDLLKPIKYEYFFKLLFQVIIGMFFILIIASCIKPLTLEIPESNYSPNFVERILLMTYNSMMLIATETAQLIVPIAFLGVVTMMGSLGFWAITYFGERLLILFQMIESEKNKTEAEQ